jgi:type VI secretion system secreted protein Hcp
MGFLKLDPIQGDAQDPNHQNWIEIQAFSWSCGNSATGAGGPGQPTVYDFSVIKQTDQATPPLFQMCCEGDKFDHAVVEIISATSNQWFIQITFDDVYITGWQTSGQADGTPALENLTFTAGVCHVLTMSLDGQNGPYAGGWNVETGQAP